MRFFCYALILLVSAQTLFSQAYLSHRRKAFRPAASGGAGPNTWYDVETFGNSDNSQFEGNTSYGYSPITVISGGTATKIRLYIAVSFADTAAKVALYNGTGSGVAVLSAGTNTIANGFSGYKEFDLVPAQSITAGTYTIAWEFLTTDAATRYKAVTGTFGFTSYSYASFPPSPFVAGTELSRNYVVSIFVQ
jgi:methionine-rich copper-binding protein CopC